ncbi:MAG: MlaD family protein [Candidatus Kappaea frigidicola]|nr:MlaD family protein [Candidatus Kappaea frigidicola]
MPKANTELRVGIFVLVGLVVFGFIIFSIGDFTLVKNGYFIKARFDDISGLDVGAPVDLIGVKVGEVKGIDIIYDKLLDKKIVELKLWIKNGVVVKRDANVRLRRLGLMGEQYVHLSLGSDEIPLLSEGGVIYGEDMISVDDVTKEVFLVTQEFKKTLRCVNEVVGDNKFRSDLKDIADNTKNATENLEDLTADLKANPWKLFNVPKAKNESGSIKTSSGNYVFQEGK